MNTTKYIIDETEKLNNTIPTIEVCGICGEVGSDLDYDEHMDSFVCCKCDVKREIGGM